MPIKKSATLKTAEHISVSKDEHYHSEDSESTQGSDLDYELKIEVLLPNKSIQSLSIPASTPWGDLRTRLCSQFKFSPSTHVVEFTSTCSSQHKRHASCPVGKMGIEMVIVKEKSKDHNASVKSKSSSHVSSISSSENTVRIIVHLARFRQSVLRVHPDVPLATVFNSICEKLKFNDDFKKRHELRHPVERETNLDLYQSLNHYNLREVYLAEKSDETGKVSLTKTAPPPPSRTKRKAPLPPSSPSSVRSDGDGSLKEKQSAEDQAQKKSSGSKRRAAPQPPQPTNSTAKAEAGKIEVSPNLSGQDIEDEKQDNPQENFTPDEILPRRPPRTQKPMKHSVVDDVTRSHDDVGPDDISEEIDVHDVTTEQSDKEHNDVIEKSDVVDDVNDDSASKVSDDPEKSTTSDVSSSCSPEIDVHEKREVDDDVVAAILPKSEKVSLEVTEDDCTKSIDDVLEEFDDVVSPDDDTASTKAISEAAEEDVSNIGTRYGDIIVYDVSEDGDVIEEEDIEVPIPITPPEEDPVDLHPDLSSSDLPPPPPAFLDVSKPQQVALVENVTHSESQQETEVSDPPNYSDDFPPPFENPDEMAHGDSTPQQPDVEQVPPSSVETPHEMSIIPHTNHITTHEQEPLPEPPTCVNSEGTDLKENKLIPTPEVLESHSELPPTEVKSVSEISESEKTALEIEKLHFQIKKMKNRSTLKQEKGTNSWHPGSKSFTFIPHNKNETTYDDFKVAPTGGIELSNNGEIKTLHHQDSSENTPVESNEVHRPHSTLPSYYKKFLGMNFASSNAK